MDKNIVGQDTIGYYAKHAKAFYESTVNVVFTTNQEKFLGYLKPGDAILDFGCGSGRDSKYFIMKKYQVEATDGSPELCELASRYMGQSVRQQLFEELREKERYEGIWSCASILHLPYEKLKEVMLRMAAALREQGIAYASFKYGSYEGERNGRYFIDMNEERMSKLLEETNVFKLELQWITADVREGREDERWFNVIMRKK